MTTPVSTAKAPASVFDALVKVAEKKHNTPVVTMFIMGLYASFWIDLGAMLAIWISSQLDVPAGPIDPVTQRPTYPAQPAAAGMKSFAFGALFPLGLILIFFIGAELFTGDTMYMVAGLLARKTGWWDLTKVWVIAWSANFIGAGIMAYFFGYLTDYADPNTATRAWLVQKTRYKVGGGNYMGWGVVFLKGILCNTLVNCAVWGAGVCDDTAGKILAIWWPIMAFAACGYEHSVANMFMCSLGLMVGAVDELNNVDFGYFIAMNLIPATLGNIFGGSIAMGLAWWYCYSYSPPGSLEQKGAAAAPVGTGPQASPTSGGMQVPMSPSKMVTA